MTEAEKQAIERLKSIDEKTEEYDGNLFKTDFETVLNLIEKQQAKIERLKTARDNWKKTFYQAKAEIEKKDKIIDLMANEIEAFDGSSYCRKKLDDIDCSSKDCLDCIKEYFKKKVNSSEQQ